MPPLSPCVPINTISPFLLWSVLPVLATQQLLSPLNPKKCFFRVCFDVSVFIVVVALTSVCVCACLCDFWVIASYPYLCVDVCGTGEATFLFLCVKYFFPWWHVLSSFYLLLFFFFFPCLLTCVEHMECFVRPTAGAKAVVFYLPFSFVFPFSTEHGVCVCVYVCHVAPSENSSSSPSLRYTCTRGCVGRAASCHGARGDEDDVCAAALSPLPHARGYSALSPPQQSAWRCSVWVDVMPR